MLYVRRDSKNSAWEMSTGFGQCKVIGIDIIRENGLRRVVDRGLAAIS